MKVYVNNKEMDVFRGCTATDAILKYKSLYDSTLHLGKLIIKDEWDNRIAEDSPLEEYQKIYFKESFQSS